MFYCEFLAPFTFERIFSLLSSFQHGFFKKLNVIYICFETAFSIHYLAVCCFPFSSLHAAKHDIFMPILLYKCQVDRIGKRSPEWWQLKDKEGKSPLNRTKEGLKTGVKILDKTNSPPGQVNLHRADSGGRRKKHKKRSQN